MTGLLRLAVALVLALTSQQMAVARGQSPVAGAMELCIAGRLATIAVDAEGNPVGPAHICPDAVQALVLSALPALQTGFVAQVSDAALPRLREALGASATPLQPKARDPPFPV